MNNKTADLFYAANNALAAAEELDGREFLERLDDARCLYGSASVAAALAFSDKEADELRLRAEAVEERILEACRMMGIDPEEILGVDED